MTDDTRAYRTLLAALDGIPESVHLTVDLIRDECEAAGLTSAEKSGAFRHAAHHGYIAGVYVHLGMGAQAVSVPTTHEAGKGRYVRLWRRTGKPIPAHVCEVAP